MLLKMQIGPLLVIDEVFDSLLALSVPCTAFRLTVNLANNSCAAVGTIHDHTIAITAMVRINELFFLSTVNSFLLIIMLQNVLRNIASITL